MKKFYLNDEKLRFCDRCAGLGVRKWVAGRYVRCVFCQGKGAYVGEHYLRFLWGQRICRLRCRYWLSKTQVARVFKTHLNNVIKLECGHFPLSSLKTIHKALKAYCDLLELREYHTLVKNPKSKRESFTEITSSTSLNFILKLKEEKETKTEKYQIVTQQVYHLPLSSKSELSRFRLKI